MNRLIAAFAALLVMALPGLAQEFPVTRGACLRRRPSRRSQYGWCRRACTSRISSMRWASRRWASKEWWGEHPTPTWPWAEEARKALNATPEVMNADGVNVEWVAAQKPDLIIATYVDMDEAIYKQAVADRADDRDAQGLCAVGHAVARRVPLHRPRDLGQHGEIGRDHRRVRQALCRGAGAVS